MSNQSSVVPVKTNAAPESSKDPIKIMIDIAENEKLSDADKSALINYAQSRFTNRRRMAYIALYTLVFSLVLLFVAIFIDGLIICAGKDPCNGILKSIEGSKTIIIWIEGLLASIVAAYYGVSAWRPSS